MTSDRDRLTQLFELQHDLQTETYGHNFQRMKLGNRLQYIKDTKLALDAELHEALNETGWKPWATRKFINRDAYVGELVDVLHFYVNLLLALGDDPADLATEVFTRYCLKNRVNADRQLSGYDGVSTKCPICKRALDDPAVECNTIKVNNPQGPVLDGWCAGSDTYYYWIKTVGDRPVTIGWRRPEVNIENCRQCGDPIGETHCRPATTVAWGYCEADKRNMPPIKIPTS